MCSAERAISEVITCPPGCHRLLRHRGRMLHMWHVLFLVMPLFNDWLRVIFRVADSKSVAGELFTTLGE